MKVLFALGSLVLVAVVALAAWLARSQRSGTPDRERAAVGEHGSAGTSRSGSEVERLRAELARERERADVAEKALAALQGGTGKAAPARPAKVADWKTRADAPWEERVKAIDWKKDVKTLVAYMRELKEAEAEGRAPRMTPAMISGLTSMQVSIQKLARELGLEESEWMKVYGNPVVGRQFSDAYASALAGEDLGPEQMERLHATALFDPDREPAAREGGALGEWASRMEWNQQWVLQTRGILTPEQQANLEKTLSPSFMVNGYTAHPIPAGTPEAAGSSVAEYWSRQWKLPEGSAVLPYARQFAEDHAAIVRQYAAQYGTTLPRDREIELQVKLLDLQIAAERRIAESLPLDAETLKRVQAGSGRALRFTQP